MLAIFFVFVYNKRRRLAAIQQNSDMDGRIAGYEG